MARLCVHIFGASGAGTSTLGRALGERLALAHLDTDDFFWMPTDPPFTGLLTPDPELRLARLRERERQRYGALIEPGGARHTAYLEFMDWTARYDTAGPEMRSRAQHEAWTARLPCPVLRLDSARPLAELVAPVRKLTGEAA
jgi:hypothetical protein